MISLTPGLCQSAPLDLYMGVKQGFSESWSWPQIRWALSSSQKGSTLQKTLSVRFIFNCWLVTIQPLCTKWWNWSFVLFYIHTCYRKSRLAVEDERNILQKHTPSFHQSGWNTDIRQFGHGDMVLHMLPQMMKVDSTTSLDNKWGSHWSKCEEVPSCLTMLLRCLHFFCTLVCKKCN